MVGKLQVEDETMWKKMDKKVVRPVIGMLLVVAITVMLTSGVFVWIAGMVPTDEITPAIEMSSTARNNDGNYVNITWEIVTVSESDIKCRPGVKCGPGVKYRADVKWSDVEIKCLASGVSLTKTTAKHPDKGEFYVNNKPSKTYVGGAQTITIEFNADDLGGSDGGEVAEIDLVYTPTDGTAGVYTVVVPKAKA